MNSEPPRFVTSFLAHEDGMTSAAFSPDGLTLATGGYDCLVRLWDMATWREKQNLPGHRRGEVAFSPDGRRLISGGLHRNAHVFDTATWKIVNTLKRSSGVWALDFRPNGSEAVLVEPDDSSDERLHCPIEFWDTATWKMTGIADVGVDWVSSVAFSPDGLTVAISHHPDDLVSIWSADFMQKLHSFPAHDLATWNAVYSPDGKVLATGGADNVARLWDTNSWEMLHELAHEEFDAPSEFRNGVVSTAFSRDGKLLITGGLDGVLTVWQL